jgi:hypothetical protein
MWLLIGVLVAVVLTYVVLSVGTRIPVRHRSLDPAKIQSLLRTLLDEGETGSVLRIHVRGTDRLVQFRVHVESTGRAWLDSGFPLAPWSQVLFSEVVLLVEGMSLPHTHVSGEGAVSQFLMVEFGSDISTAEQYATSILTEVFRVVPERDCFAVLLGDFTSRVLASQRSGKAMNGGRTTD